MRILRLLTLVSVAALPLALHASEIVYSDSFTATGTLGKTSFTDALVTITGEANPSTAISEGTGFFALSLPVTFTIGDESGSFTEPMQVFLSQEGGTAGTGEAGFSSSEFALIFTENPAFATYQLSQLIAPTTGISAFNSFADTFASYATNDGSLELNTVSESTFSANSPVPEPSSIALLATGALGVFGAIKRRFVNA
jgi:PEP-CTERM motif